MKVGEVLLNILFTILIAFYVLGLFRNTKYTWMTNTEPFDAWKFSTFVFNGMSWIFGIIAIIFLLCVIVSLFYVGDVSSLAKVSQDEKNKDKKPRFVIYF